MIIFHNLILTFLNGVVILVIQVNNPITVPKIYLCSLLCLFVCLFVFFYLLVS